MFDIFTKSRHLRSFSIDRCIIAAVRLYRCFASSLIHIFASAITGKSMCLIIRSFINSSMLNFDTWWRAFWSRSSRSSWSTRDGVTYKIISSSWSVLTRSDDTPLNNSAKEMLISELTKYDTPDYLKVLFAAACIICAQTSSSPLKSPSQKVISALAKASKYTFTLWSTCEPCALRGHRSKLRYAYP